MSHPRIVALVLLLTLAACAPPPVATPTTGGSTQPAESRAAKQTLVIASTSLLPNLSPEAGEVFRQGFMSLYDTVVSMDANYKVLPWAAERWDQPNSTTWRMILRKDMTFSNGDKLTAADVEFTGKFMLETKTAPISQFAGLADVKMVDDYTVDFITKTPDPSVLSAMAYLLIMPKTYFNTVGRQGFAAKPIGSGPYEIAEYKSGELYRMSLRSTPHPFRKPIATEVTFRAIPQVAGITAGLRTGEIDLALSVVSADQASQLKNDGFGVFKQYTENMHLFFPTTEAKDRNSPLMDRKVRLALNYAIDKDTINKQLYGGDAQVVGHLAPPASPAFDPDIKPIPYDVAKAKSLLAEAGYANGFKLAAGLDYSGALTDDVFLSVQSYLKAVGVETALNKVEYGQFIDRFVGKSPKGDIFWSSLRDSNGFNALERSYYGCINPNGTAVWWCNQDFDKLNTQASGEADIVKRTALLRQATRAIADDVPAIFMLMPAAYGVSNNKIRGITGENPIMRIYDGVYKVN